MNFDDKGLNIVEKNLKNPDITQSLDKIDIKYKECLDKIYSS